MKIVRSITVGLGVLALGLGLAVPAEAAMLPAYVKDYRYGSCQPRGEGNDRGLTWLKVSAWNISSTTRRYHVAVREDGGFHGTGFHTIRARKSGTFSTVLWRGSSPYDDNPVEFYKNVSGTYHRDVFANWTDILGGLPFGSINCAVGSK